MEPAADAYREKHSWYKLGMWLFIASEIMFFAALFDSYILLRANNADAARESQKVLRHMMPYAAANTGILIFSSLTMALAVSAARRGHRRLLTSMLLVTMLLGGAFLAIKAVEYKAKFTHGGVVKAERREDGKIVVAEVEPLFKSWGLLRGDELLKIDGAPIADPAELERARPFSRLTVGARPPYGETRDVPLGVVPATNVFFGSYFLMTGVHGLHVIGGVVALFFLWIAALRGRLDGRYTSTAMTGLYWYFVDVVWILMFSALYLI